MEKPNIILLFPHVFVGFHFVLPNLQLSLNYLGWFKEHLRSISNGKTQHNIIVSQCFCLV